MEDYGARIRRAYRDWHDANDPKVMSWAEITRRAAKALRVPETSVAVLKWKDGKQEPTVTEYQVLGEILNADWVELASGKGRQSLTAEVGMEKPRPPVSTRKRKRNRG